MIQKRSAVTSGVSLLDRLLGGLFIGDNVVWYDEAGSLADFFCRKFIQSSGEQDKALIYVDFDRSPKNLMDKLGPLTEHPNLTVLDCFTHGKGGGAEIFLRFYKDGARRGRCAVRRVEDPCDPDKVMNLLYDIHGRKEGDVRFVFESLTGMQELWGDEDHILTFYAKSCPRLYELNTIAYWIIEKFAHSQRLRAHINKIAQVAIELSLRRGKTSLKILKAEKRNLENLSRPYNYWNIGSDIFFDAERRSTGRIDLGARLKSLRNRSGLSQTELARLVGVTPSNISQIESNLIYPSLPALLKIAEILSVDISAFFQRGEQTIPRIHFPAAEAAEVHFPNLSRESVSVRRLTPADFEQQAEPFIVEILPRKSLNAHFFTHKGEEAGYLISGQLEFRHVGGAVTVNPGDLIYLTSDMPTHWKNPGPETAKLLWLKIG